MTGSLFEHPIQEGEEGRMADQSGEKSPCEEKREPNGDSVYGHSKEREDTLQRDDSPSLSQILGLGATAVTVFSVTASFSLHLTRSIECGYPLFLAQISAADIVPVLPVAAGALLLVFPCLLGLPRLISSLEDIAANRIGIRTIMGASFILGLSILLPITLFVACISISTCLAITYFVVVIAAWAAMIIIYIKRDGACRGAEEDGGLGKVAPSSGTDHRTAIFRLVLNSAYVGLSVCITAFIGVAVQTLRPPAPLAVLGTTLLLAAGVLIALKCVTDKKGEVPILAPSNRAYLLYFMGFVVLVTSVAAGVLMASPALSGGRRYVVACERVTAEENLVNATAGETNVEYLLLDTFANGNAVVSADGESGDTKTYKLISLVDGYSIRVDGEAPGD